MSKDALLARAYESVLAGDEDEALAVAEATIAEGVDPLEVISEGFSRGMTRVGQLFADEEISLPEVIVAADVMQLGMSRLEEHIPRAQRPEPLATVVIGTAEGDVHDIGKRIVATMLSVNGFKVIDLGRDVPAGSFVDAATSNEADIVGCSALMTSTMIGMRTIEEALLTAGLKGRVKTMIGGAATTQEYADKIGADAYAENANDAVAVARELTGAR